MGLGFRVGAMGVFELVEGLLGLRTCFLRF